MWAGIASAAQPLRVTTPLVLMDARRGPCDSWLVAFLKETGYQVRTRSSPLDQRALARVSVLAMAVGMNTTRYTEAEVEAIREFFEKGGGLLISGQSWSFVEYSKGRERDYPINRLTPFTGIHVSQTYGWNPNTFAEHPVTKGVKKLSWGKGVSSVLKVQKPAVPLARDARGYVVMAAAEAKGKAAHIGHEWLHKRDWRRETDAETFLRNVMHWLAPITSLTDDDLRSQLSKRGAVGWIVSDPQNNNTVWAALDGTLLLVNRLSGEIQEFPQILGEPAVATAIGFADELVWVGTKKGLVTYDPRLRTWTRYAANADYRLLDVEIVSIDTRDATRQLVVEVQTRGRVKSFTYDLEKKRWTEGK